MAAVGWNAVVAGVNVQKSLLEFLGSFQRRELQRLNRNRTWEICGTRSSMAYSGLADSPLVEALGSSPLLDIG